nr:MAG TPA: hypothetical protein [Caudoviricetes sp.]
MFCKYFIVVNYSEYFALKNICLKTKQNIPFVKLVYQYFKELSHHKINTLF